MAAGRMPQAHFLLVGERHSSKAESVAFERRIVQQFVDSGLGDRLHRLGWRDDVPELLNEIDLLIHAARQEPLGRVLLEAAASGVPIVATDVGGTREILEDEISAVLVPPDDARALADAVVRLTMNTALAGSLAQRARSVAVEKYDIGQAAQALLEFWQSTVSGTEH